MPAMHTQLMLGDEIARIEYTECGRFETIGGEMRVKNEKNQEFIDLGGVLLISSPVMSEKMQKYIEEQEYEKNEIAFALKHVESEDVILELGAGIGALSSHILKKKKVQRYICVEANPHMVQLMKKNHAVNGIRNCEIVNGVMTNDTEKTQFDFYVCEDFWASSLRKPEHYTSIKQVRGHVFNDILRDVKPSFIICDIEGGEFDLFVNGVDISSVQKICIEIHKTTDRQLVDLYAYFVDSGFYLVTPPLQAGVCFFVRRT